MKEVWKEIPGFIGYEVSSHGNIRSYWKKCGRKYLLSGNIQHVFNPSIYKGYRSLKLRVNIGKYLFRRISRLVLETFIGPCPQGYQACHDDGIPCNDRLDNLRWDTPKNNHYDKHSHGTYPIGIKNSNAKLTDEQVMHIRSLYSQGYSQDHLGVLFCITKNNISKIVTKRTWKHL